MTTTLEQTLTPAQETALAHMRARYPDQLNRYTDPLLAATQALILTTHDLTKDPTLVDRTTLDHAMRLIRMARRGALLAELLTLTTSHARGDTYQRIAAHRGYSGPTQAHQRIKRLRYLLGLREIDTPIRRTLPTTTKVARSHLISHVGNTPLLELAVPLFAVWLLHQPRPDPTWFNTPTPPTDLDPTSRKPLLRILDDHTALPLGTRNDVVDLIHSTLHTQETQHAAP